ncbi:unnamed protein product [Linum trigynum]|uniref:2-oxoglutarate-dependent dioxygenase DAO n=1 Tax=Linum trigynum TaxID=586398 RepID=A0AAV2CXR2_9ROSI
MGSDHQETTSVRIPTIDFSDMDLKAPAASCWNMVKSQVWEAVQEYGCFQATYGDLPQQLRQAMDAAMEEVFSLPVEAKRRNVSDKPLHGYIGSSPVMPLYESLGIDDPETDHGVQSFTNVMWPSGHAKFSEIVLSFSKKLSELDQAIRRMSVESLGVEKKYMEEQLNSTCYQLRLTHYREPQTVQEKKIGLKAHVDQNTLTILHQNHVDGLDVQTRDGEWISVKFAPQCFLVLVGESFNAWTNGRLQCPYHRVMIRGHTARLSAGLFAIPKQGYMVKAPQELVDEEHPLLFKPYDYIDYLKLRSKEIGKSVESPLKAYFGV